MSRTVCFSCSVFGGYTTRVNLEKQDTLQTVTKKAINVLKQFLKQNNLWALQDQLCLLENKYHIHSHTLAQILESSAQDVIYICPCCNQQTA